MPVIMSSLKEALEHLLEKYDIPYEGGFELLCGSEIMGSALEERMVPLQPWRSERKFTELFKLVDNETIENVCLLRFSHMTDSNQTLESILYKEFDLVEYIGHGRIVSLNAVFTDGRTGNVIVKLDNGVIGSVEAGNLLPDGQDDIDRHELVARRGVANDIPVDVQIPLQSIYTFTEEGQKGYTDVDFELYGFSGKEIGLVRAQMDFYKAGAAAVTHIERHKRLCSIVRAAISSDKNHRKEVIS